MPRTKTEPKYSNIILHTCSTKLQVSKQLQQEAQLYAEKVHIYRCTVQMAFQYETVYAWITRVTDKERM